MINEVLYAKPPYDTLRDFAPVTLGASLPNILVVHPALPVKSVPGYEAIQWYGLLAPAGTARDSINRLQSEVARILVLPDVRNSSL